MSISDMMSLVSFVITVFMAGVAYGKYHSKRK